MKNAFYDISRKCTLPNKIGNVKFHGIHDKFSKQTILQAKRKVSNAEIFTPTKYNRNGAVGRVQ